LSDYENVYGSIDANSGRNALARDPDFTAGFLERHKNKLMFGSDCACTDGHGAGTTGGQCLARNILTLLLKYAKPDDFRKIVYGNAARVYRFPA
jgi:predicted TIM-barrel fold metal-dependent hydrolase